MQWLVGMNGLGVVSIILGGAVLCVSVLSAFGAGLGMVINSQIRREREEQTDTDLADAIAKQIAWNPAEPRPHPRPMSHRPMRELEFSSMTTEDMERAFDLEPGVPAPKPGDVIRLGETTPHPSSAG